VGGGRHTRDIRRIEGPFRGNAARVSEGGKMGESQKKVKRFGPAM